MSCLPFEVLALPVAPAYSRALLHSLRNCTLVTSVNLFPFRHPFAIRCVSLFQISVIIYVFGQVDNGQKTKRESQGLFSERYEIHLGHLLATVCR